MSEDQTPVEAPDGGDAAPARCGYRDRTSDHLERGECRWLGPRRCGRTCHIECPITADGRMCGSRQQMVIRLSVRTYGARGAESAACARTYAPRRRRKRRQRQQDGQNAEYTPWFQVQS